MKTAKGRNIAMTEYQQKALHTTLDHMKEENLLNQPPEVIVCDAIRFYQLNFAN